MPSYGVCTPCQHHQHDECTGGGVCGCSHCWPDHDWPDRDDDDVDR